MPGLSTTKKLGILGRVAARQAGQSRLLNAGWTAVRITASRVSQVLHLLFLQITGVFFLAFAAGGGFGAWRAYHKWHAGQSGPGKMVLAAGFSALFLWFAVSSFWRAAKKA